MYVFKKSTIRKAQIITISIWFVAVLIIGQVKTLTITNAILLFLAGLGLFIVINPLLKPILDARDKSLQKEQKELDRHIAIAKKQGKKQYEFGEKVNGVKRHVVWATSKRKADKIYKESVAEKANKNKHKNYYYISPLCNNLKD